MTPSAAVVSIDTQTPATNTPAKTPKQDKTPPLYKLAKIPYTYFLPDQQTREARKAKRKERKNPVQTQRKGTGPTIRELNEAQLRKLILETIAGYGDPDGTNCQASAETIAFHTGCGTRCIADHKAALEAAGWLTRDFRLNRTDDCSVHIPEHVWAEVQRKSAEHKEMLRNRASKGGWGLKRPKVDAAYAGKVDAAYASKVDAAYAGKVDAAYAADDLSLTSSNTSSLPLEENADKNKSSQDNGPRLVHGQRKPIEDFKLRVSKLTEGEILFTANQTFTLKSVLSEYTPDELFEGFRLSWDKTEEKQRPYMAAKFIANAHVLAQQVRDTLQEKAAEKAAIARAAEKMVREAEEGREAKRIKDAAEALLLEEELPD